MLVLTATNELQGRAPGDYAHTVAGELVTALAAQCDNDEQCGCNRGFPGFASHLATTTAIVTDLPHITEGDLRDAIYDYLDRGGWIDLLDECDDHEEALEALEADLDPDVLSANLWGQHRAITIGDIIDEHLEVIQTICQRFPVGTVIERSGLIIRPRSLPWAA